MSNVKELAEQVIAAVKTYVARSFAPLETRLDELDGKIKAIPAPLKGEPGERGPQGESGPVGPQGEKGWQGAVGPEGRDGVDGKDGAPGERGSDGKDGAGGRDGIDGKSLAVDDIRPLFDSAMATWQLEFERRSMDLVQRTLDRIEKPKDGRDGKDGRDCLDLATLDISVEDDFRTWRFVAMAGAQEIVVTKHVPMPMHQGVYRAGEKYERGDIVSFGGSAFIARRDTTSKPETDDSWQLFVKRGRDGKDGLKGEKGEDGRDGRQLR